MKLMIVEDDKALAKGIELALSEKENEITVCHDLKTAEESRRFITIINVSGVFAVRKCVRIKRFR